MPLRWRSLFWTFASSFLVVLVLGFLLQVVLLFTVVAPLLSQERRAHLTAQAESCAGAIAELTVRDADPEELVRTLRAFRGPGRDVVFVLETPEGWWSTLPFGALPEPLTRSLEAGLGRSVPAEAFPRPGRRGRGPGDDGGSIRSFPPGARTRVVSAPVGDVGSSRAFVHVVYFERPLDLPRQIPRPGLVFIPAAALLATLAGLWLFRGFARRLGSLEAHMARVAAGDLSARVPDLGSDEIGALGRALNEMTARLEESRLRLEESRTRLEASERQRRQFLADVTHELSTPLTSIRGFAETLLDEQVPTTPAERQSYLAHILAEGRRMDRLVTDLLDLAKLEAGAAPFEPSVLDLADLVRRHAELRGADLARQGIELEVAPVVGPVWVRADGGRLEQALDNLLQNGARYGGASGHLRVGIELERPRDVKLVVEDRGPGIAAEDLPYVFDRFYRGEPSRPTGGSGLGLAIVQEIARRHGGTAWAENRSSGGARIGLRLPILEDESP